MKRITPLLLIVNLLIVFSCEDIAEQVLKGKEKPVSTTNIENEPDLKYVLDYVGFKAASGSARSNSDGVSLNVDEIIKVLKADSVLGVYTILVEDDKTNSLTNFVIEELKVGYSVFYQEFQWEGNELPDFERFTGIITRTDLDGSTIMRIRQVDGEIVPDVLYNGKTNQEKQCVEDIKTEKYYSDCDFAYKNQVKIFVCRSVTIVITVTVGDCPSSDDDTDYGSDGSTGTGGGASGGTYIPPSGGYTPTIPEGGSPNSGGAGGTGGTLNNHYPVDEPVNLPSTGIVPKILMKLNSALELDPFKLQDVPCEEIKKWQPIAQFKIPTSVQNKINDLDESILNPATASWSVEDINNAEGAVVNMDYFPVTISKFPKKPDGTTYTAPEFFQYFRKNFNSFLDQNITQFGPYNAAENAIWLSPNPLGAVMRFDIPVNAIISQDGTVICSDSQESSWIFTTLKSPRDWDHPVSGHRKFGYEKNTDGSFTFYTRGVDRVTEQF